MRSSNKVLKRTNLKFILIHCKTLKRPHSVQLGLVYHHSALEHHSVFDEIHQIFTDLGNGTKHAGYDHGTLEIATSRHCGKKVQCG